MLHVGRPQRTLHAWPTSGEAGSGGQREAEGLGLSAVSVGGGVLAGEFTDGQQASCLDHEVWVGGEANLAALTLVQRFGSKRGLLLGLALARG